MSATSLPLSGRDRRFDMRKRVTADQRDASQLHHVTVDGLAEWIAWWDAQEASA
jgi:hypothetical protein